MNRFKKEEKRKYLEKRKGKTADEIAEIDNQETVEQAIEFISDCLHSKIFKEEYDHLFDGISDYAARRRGINPMSDDYIKRMAVKRECLGVSQLSSSGLSESSDSNDFCFKLVDAAFKSEGANERWIEAQRIEGIKRSKAGC
jgi:hypothetical protein